MSTTQPNAEMTEEQRRAMKIAEADEKLELIARLASEIEEDKELEAIDPRYTITAKWIDTDIENASA